MQTLWLRKPTSEILGRFVAERSLLGFTYAAVGATAHSPPDGFLVDRTRIELGAGQRVFETAQAALQGWQQFGLGWVEAWSPETPLEVGQTVAILGRAVGLWWLNACRIVYTVNETGPMTSFGFAYGTLPGHVQSGEERFLIEWNRHTDQVFYDILAFSRPQHLLARLGYPLVRRKQKQFGRQSAARMAQVIGHPQATAAGQ